MLTQSSAVCARCLLLLIVIMTRGSYHQWARIDRLSQPSPHQQNPLRSRKLWQDYNQGRFPCRVPIITILPNTLQEGAPKDGNPTQLREPVVTSLDCCVLLRGLPSLSRYLAAAPASDLILESLPTNQRPSSLSGREPSIGSNTRSTSACFCSHPKSLEYLT